MPSIRIKYQFDLQNTGTSWLPRKKAGDKQRIAIKMSKSTLKMIKTDWNFKLFLLYCN